MVIMLVYSIYILTIWPSCSYRVFISLQYGHHARIQYLYPYNMVIMLVIVFLSLQYGHHARIQYLYHYNMAIMLVYSIYILTIWPSCWFISIYILTIWSLCSYTVFISLQYGHHARIQYLYPYTMVIMLVYSIYILTIWSSCSYTVFISLQYGHHAGLLVFISLQYGHHARIQYLYPYNMAIMLVYSIYILTLWSSCSYTVFISLQYGHHARI